MRSIFGNEIIGDPVYMGLMAGGLLEWPSTDDFSKADYPGLRAIRIRRGGAIEWILARDLTDPYEIEGPITPPGYMPGEIIYYTANGSFVKADYPGLAAIKIRMVGGGAAGGGAAATASSQSVGSGGGGGAYVEATVLEADLASSEAVTVGQGGAGNSGADGDAGTDSIFDTISGEVRADAGVPGSTLAAGSSIAGQLGGTGGLTTSSTGDLKIGGDDGGAAWRYSATNSNVMIGGGGVSGMGGGGGRGRLNAAGEAGGGPGGGGGGASNGTSQAARAGGAGADGIVIVEVLYARDPEAVIVELYY